MAGQQQLYLHVVRGVMDGRVAEFATKKRVSIGRTRANAFQIKHDTVSQRHAVIVHKNGQWFVTDCNSSNGTSINGVFVTPDVPAELRNGDLLGIGPENEVRVKIDETEAEDALQLEDELGSEQLTLKEWFEQEKERLAEETASMAEASVGELVEHAEALKRTICEAAGVEYLGISSKFR